MIDIIMQENHNRDRQRIYQLDNIRALAIILVVFGHSIIIYSPEWNLYTTINNAPVFATIKSVINLFQMPLFFMLSGYLLNFELKNSFSQFVKKKLKRLIIPYFLIALLWMLPVKCFVGYKDYEWKNFLLIFLRDILLGRDNGHLWFLPCLFIDLVILYSIIIFIYHSSANNQRNNILLFIVAFFAHELCNYAKLGLLINVLSNFLWLDLGRELYLIANNKRKKILKRAYWYAIVILEVLLIYVSIIISNKINVVTSFTGCLLIYHFMPNTENKYCDFISKYSYGIYLVHSPLIYITYSFIPNLAPILIMIINFLGFGTLAIAITYIMMHSKLRILMGM